MFFRFLIVLAMVGAVLYFAYQSGRNVTIFDETFGNRYNIQVVRVARFGDDSKYAYIVGVDSDGKEQQSATFPADHIFSIREFDQVDQERCAFDLVSPLDDEGNEYILHIEIDMRTNSINSSVPKLR